VPPEDRDKRLNMNTRLSPAAVGLMLAAMSLIPLGDTAGKLLTTQFAVAPAFVAWSRFAIGAGLVMVILRIAPSLQLLRDWRIWLRGGLIAAAIASILTALRTEPIANAFGAFFIGPAVSYILSVRFLREPFTWLRAALVAMGFAGVLLVVQPQSGMGGGIWFAVLAGCFYGSFLTTSRWLSDAAPARALLLSQLIVGSVLLAPFGLLTLPPLSMPIAALTLASAACSALGNLLLVLAYARAGASTLAPLVYAQLFAATVLGATVFGTLPDRLAVTGLAVLALSGIGALALRR
jgi:drug/metabolite transporter (DMT)-like permease